MLEIPALPPARGFEGGTGTAELHPRYEDITQDGRVILPTLMPGLGVAVWRNLLAHREALEGFRQQGILPILRRLVIVADAPGPFSVHAPIAFEGTWRLAKQKEGDRLFVNMWLDAFAPNAHTLGPPPHMDAPRVRVGRIFAEHVITKPFAKSAAERKVTRLDVADMPSVPEDEHVYESGESLLEGRTLDLANASEITFGMMHTDSNQHVNSLVYPRMFEEALVQRHRDANRLARAFEMRWRKPFFAGDRAQIAVSLEGDTAIGTFTPPNADRASCAIAARLG